MYHVTKAALVHVAEKSLAPVTEAEGQPDAKYDPAVPTTPQAATPVTAPEV